MADIKRAGQMEVSGYLPKFFKYHPANSKYLGFRTQLTLSLYLHILIWSNLTSLNSWI